jgi:60 kDa SS-A/Ro ribonucleoprotein
VAVPQNVKSRDDEVKNNAGGFVFEVSPEQRLLRFLILGVDGGTYYQSEKALAKSNVSFVEKALEADPDLVDLIISVSVEGRAPRQSATLFSLAAATGSKNPETRKRALAAINEVCRTSTMLFEFLNYAQQYRGWGSGLKSAVARWYEAKSADQLAYQTVKYRQREGWTHRDVMRQAHPRGVNPMLGHWILGHEGVNPAELPRVVQGYLLAQEPGANFAELVSNYNLPWEALPDVALREPATWEALVPNMPLGALIRNLGRMSNIGLLKPLSGASKVVVNRLASEDDLKRARIHPFNVLVSMKTYSSGRGFKGNMSWQPDPRITDALEGAYYGSFPFVRSAGKRTLIALDTSGSMSRNMNGSPLTCAEGTAAMAMVIAKTELDYHIVHFSRGGGYRGGIAPLNITANSSLNQAMSEALNHNWGGTDCALPMIYAEQNQLEVDTFIVMTDNETWAGNVKPHKALASYRQKSGIAAREIVVGMTATNFTIADPTDPGQLDVVGFDTNAPDLMASFSRGDF